jgi:hypothetical protein
MTPPVQYTLIDENTDLTIAPGYDPLLKDSFEEYIHITEKVNPGKRRSFNNVPNQETRDVHVSGLVLHWKKELSKSKLRAVAGRESIEHLFMYADTIVVDAHLKFPQTAVTIYARRLILGPEGKIDTTPKAFGEKYAHDDTPAKSRTPKYRTIGGADGDAAGSITLLVKTLTCPDKKECFILDGSDGQHGERGGLKDRVTSDKVPVTWDEVLYQVKQFDDIVRNSEDWWTWPATVKTELQTGLIYYAYVHIIRFQMLTTEWHKYVSFGNQDAENADAGLDAYRSGDGGNGGDGGTLRVTDPNVAAASVSQRGGASGKSDRIEGTPRKANGTDKKHVSFAAVGTDSGTRLNSYANSQRGVKEYTKSLPAKDGDAAKGADGKPGKDGGIEWLAGHRGDWLHPYVLETVVQYARDAWLAGDRQPGKWLLQHYQTAFRERDAQ